MSVISGDPILTESVGRVTIEWSMYNSRDALKYYVRFIDSTSFSLFDAEWLIRIKPSRYRDFKMNLRRKYFSEIDPDIEYQFRIMSEDGTLLFYDSGVQEFFFSKHFISTPNLEVGDEYLKGLWRIFKRNTNVKILCTVRPLNAPVSIVSQQTSSHLENAPTLAIPEGPDLLSKNFKELLNSGLNADVSINVKGHVFSAHQLVLEARCPVFTSMFQHDMKENRSKVIDITDCDPGSFQEFLTYLYSGKVDHVTVNNAPDLYQIADKYSLTELVHACKECMKRDISVDTFCNIILIAEMHDEFDLMKIASEFFTTHGEGIIVTEQWKAFLSEHPALVNELLIHAFKIWKYLPKMEACFSKCTPS